MQDNKKVLFSGIQPSGVFTIGNYFGAIKNWVKLQEEYECFYCIVDLHALTVPQVPSELRNNSMQSMGMLLASGVDPNRATIYFQSHVPAHAELTWLLNCFAYMGELNRMTQFKDKSQKQGENIRVALFDYPVLMASDILLFGTEIVPVGEDQRQHLELTRDLAQRFNNAYSPTFNIPEGYIPEKGARVMSLQDPMKKMSKSDENVNAFITLTDNRDTIIKKFKRAVTDSDSVIKYDQMNKKGISNLIEIYSCATGQDYESVEKEFEGKGYGEFKIAVGEVVADVLKPINLEYDRIMKEKSYIEDIVNKGRELANFRANRILNKVKKKVGLYIGR